MNEFQFVVEDAEKERALKRYAKLKSFGLNIFLDSSDAGQYHLYFKLSGSPSDTSKILDSLRRLYTPPGKKAYIRF